MADEATTEETQEETTTEDTQTGTDDETSGIAEETGESATSDETVDDPAADPGKKGGVQKKIDKLTKQRADAEREAAYHKGRADAVEASVQPNDEPEDDEGLHEYDFTSTEEYVKAEVAAGIKKGIEGIQVENSRKTQSDQAAASEVVLDKAREKYDDFDAVVFASTGVVTNPEILKVLQTTGDAMGDLLYYMGSNPKESQKINAMSPMAAAVELGAIKAKLMTKSKTPPNKTNAPDPLKRVGGGGASNAKTEDKMSQEELFAKWEATRIKRLTGG